MTKFSTLDQYYQELLSRENQSNISLISSWEDALITDITQDIKQAIKESNLRDTVLPIRKGSSNQSIGNQIADQLAIMLNERLLKFRIEKCLGHGYPDRIISIRDNSAKIALEIKSTANWKDTDSNRVVLTSSSEKLRINFQHPIYHLLLSAIYSLANESAKIHGIRLDFLQPSTQVAIRLEASVSHKILAEANHRFEFISL